MNKQEPFAEWQREAIKDIFARLHFSQEDKIKEFEKLKIRPSTMTYLQANALIVYLLRFYVAKETKGLQTVLNVFGVKLEDIVKIGG